MFLEPDTFLTCCLWIYSISSFFFHVFHLFFCVWIKHVLCFCLARLRHHYFFLNKKLSFRFFRSLHFCMMALPDMSGNMAMTLKILLISNRRCFFFLFLLDPTIFLIFFLTFSITFLSLFTLHTKPTLRFNLI